jgi:DNA topoisomerase-1
MHRPEDEDEEAEKKNEKALPPLNEGDVLELLDLDTKQNFTQPPPRYTEATLVKALEENGIGRPSTYGAILTTIQARDYTYKHDGKFHPTHLGALVVKLLKGSFGDIIDETYTASLEERLDEIEDGDIEWTALMREFSGKFNADLVRAATEMTQVKGTGLETDEKCETCGSPMVIKFGRFGEFLACSTTRVQDHEGNAEGETPRSDVRRQQIICDKCGKPMQLKRSRFGQFFACTGYPDCKNTKDPKLAKQAANLPSASRSRSARTAARKWFSSPAATARSTRAPAIPSARRSARSAAVGNRRRRRSRPA